MLASNETANDCITFPKQLYHCWRSTLIDFYIVYSEREVKLDQICSGDLFFADQVFLMISTILGLLMTSTVV